MAHTPKEVDPKTTPDYDSLLARVQQMERETERYIASCPAAVQPTLREELARRRGRKGLKPGSNENWAKAWSMAMRELGDRRPASLGPLEWEGIVDRWLSEPRPIRGVMRPLVGSRRQRGSPGTPSCHAPSSTTYLPPRPS